KILGAAYLIWLGVKTWRSLARVPPMDVRDSANVSMSHGRSLLLGFVVTLGNPKAILFYGALLPTFVDVAALTLPDVAALAAVMTLVLFLVLGVYAWLAARAGRVVKSERALR